MENTSARKSNNGFPSAKANTEANARGMPRAESRMRATHARSGTMRHKQTRRGQNQGEKMSLYEKLMLQCMGAGLIFSAILIGNLFDYEPIKEMNEAVRSAIGQHIEAETLERYVIDAQTYLFALQKTIFGSENGQEKESSEETLPPEEAEHIEETPALTERQVRIDEEVLNQLNALGTWHEEDETEKK